MTTSNTLFVLAVLSALWGVVSQIRITAWLQRRGVKINYFLLRPMIVKYVHQYHEMSRAEFGQVGPLFYHFLIAMNAALVCLVIGLANR